MSPQTSAPAQRGGGRALRPAAGADPGLTRIQAEILRAYGAGVVVTAIPARVLLDADITTTLAGVEAVIARIGKYNRPRARRLAEASDRAHQPPPPPIAEPDAREPMSRAQRAVYDAIKAYIAEHGHSPSVRDIAEAAWTSQQNVSYHVKHLVEMGWISHEPGKARTVRIVEAGDG